MSDTDSTLNGIGSMSYRSTAPEKRLRLSMRSNGDFYATTWPKGLISMYSQSQTCASASFSSGLDENPCDVICERLDSSIVNAIFGSPDGTECAWLLFESAIGIARPDDSLFALVTPQASGSPDRDGFALPAKRATRPAIISGSFNFTRLKRPALVILGKGKLRMLDMVTWEVTTITSSLPSSLHMYPGLSGLLPTKPFVPSDDHVLLESEGDILRLDLASGKLISRMPGGQRYDFLPIPSDVPTYLLRQKENTALLRHRDGLTEVAKIILKPGSAIAHCSYFDFTPVVSALNGEDYFFNKNLLWKKIPWVEYLPTCDFSSLLSNDFFPHDLVFKIEPQALKVSSDTLRNLHPDLNTLQLMKVVKTFPDASVDAFIRYLLGSPLKSNTNESHIIWSHSIFIYAALGLGNNLPFKTFVFSILPYLTTSEACNMLRDIWNDTHTNWTRADPLIEALALHVVAQCFEEFQALLIASASGRNMELAFAVHAIKDTKTAIVWSEPSPLRGLQPIQVYEADCTLTQPSLLLNGPNEFVFVLNLPDRRLAMVGDIRYLYTRWNWFKRLIDCGGSEKLNRVAEMPGWMSPVELATILGYVHAGWCWADLKCHEALNLLEHRHEMELVDRDGNPHPTFADLHHACRSLLFPNPTEKNVLGQVTSYHRIGEMAKVKELLTAIVTQTYALEPMELFDELSVELLALLKEVRGDWKRSQVACKETTVHDVVRA